MILLYIFWGIILFLLVLLCCPVFVHVSFREYLDLNVRFLFFSFNFSQKEEKNLQEGEYNFKDNNKLISNFGKSKFLSIIKEKGLFGFLKILKSVVDILSEAGKKIIKKIHVRSFDLCLLVVKDNAADTAIIYGKVCTLINYAKSILLKNINENKCYVEIIPGFNKTESRVNFYSEIYFFPISIIGVICISLYKFVKNVYLNIKSERV